MLCVGTADSSSITSLPRIEAFPDADAVTAPVESGKEAHELGSCQREELLADGHSSHIGPLVFMKSRMDIDTVP